MLTKYENLRVSYIRFKIPEDSVPRTLANGDQVYAGSITMKFSAGGAGTLETWKESEPLNLYLTTDAAGTTIKSCSTFDTPSVEAMCVSLGLPIANFIPSTEDLTL